VRNAWWLNGGVILSAQSTDKTVNEITPAIFKRYPNIAGHQAAARLITNFLKRRGA